MARKGQVSIQDNVETNEELEEYLIAHYNQLICMEVYSDFCGPCLAMGAAVRKAKLEIGQDRIAMVKALADKIQALVRFKNQSEPVFLFISKGRLTRAMFGANGIEMCKIVEDELKLLTHEEQTGVERPRTDIEAMLPEESEKLEESIKIEEESRQAVAKLKTITQAARKKRVADRLSKHLQRMNFILFWPHCHQAHYDLYEKWDLLNIQIGAKETFQVTEDGVKEALYMSDIDANEACVHSLLSGEALVVLFKMFDTDTRSFVKLIRQALYEDIPVPKDDVPPEKQVPPIPAFERYATISKTKQQVRRERYEAKLEKLRQEKEEMDRLAREKERMEREAEEERLLLEKQKRDEERMARIQAGLPEEPEPEVVEEPAGEELQDEADTEAPTEPDAPLEDTLEEDEEPKVEEEEVFHSDVSVDGEDYIPPGGLFVPGLYSPPNDMAKANALAYFFPKVVAQITKIESEVLPPHVLVMFNIDKRNDVKDVIQQFPDEIINKGIFVGEDPFNMEHIAYSIKQYDKTPRLRKHKDRLVLMVSRKRSLPLLQLAGLNPCYISSDTQAGERDCLTLFPVGYGDDFEEEESVVEEEVEEIPPDVVEEVVEAPPVEEPTNEDKDEDDED